jgi:Holliday junction resolvasome RuvABC endonuclease subunit
MSLRASKTLLGKSRMRRSKNIPLVIGIDAQPRGLAIGAVNGKDGSYRGHLWIPFDHEPHEKMIHVAYEKAKEIISKLQPMIVTVEQPTAKRSKTTAILWGIYGAVVAGSYAYCDICESIVVPQWKSLSGLNKWAKKSGTIKKGFVPKDAIPLGMQEILGVPNDLNPLDLYDALGIAYASYIRNEERQNGKPSNGTTKRTKQSNRPKRNNNGSRRTTKSSPQCEKN